MSTAVGTRNTPPTSANEASLAVPMPQRDPATVRLYYRFMRFLLRAAFLLYFRGRVFHTERVPQTGGVLICCNHQSVLDPPLGTLAIARECHYMGRDSLFRNPLFRKLIVSLNCFPIRRETADLRAIKEALRRLKAGFPVVAFPEGTRTIDGSIGTMHAGVILIAKKARVPVLPTLIDGAFQSWPRDARLPRPGRVTIAYGEPIEPALLQTLTDDECVELVRDRIVALQQRFGLHRDR